MVLSDTISKNGLQFQNLQNSSYSGVDKSVNCSIQVYPRTEGDLAAAGYPVDPVSRLNIVVITKRVISRWGVKTTCIF
jgi:hypothetical protein